MLEHGWATIGLAIVGCVILALVADRIVAHHAGWLANEPYLSDDDRRATLARIDLRWKIGKVMDRTDLAAKDFLQARADKLDASIVSQRLREFQLWQGVSRYPFVLLFPPLVLLVGIWSNAVASLAALLLPLVLISACCWTPGTWRAWIRAPHLAWSALSGWIAYGRGTPMAPGLHVGQSGSAKRRTWLLAIGLAGFTLSFMPALRYIPIPYYFVPRHEREITHSQGRNGGLVGIYTRRREGPPIDEPIRPRDWPASRPPSWSNEATMRYDVFFQRKREAWVLIAIDGLARRGDWWPAVSLGSGLVINLFFPIVVLYATLVAASRLVLLPIRDDAEIQRRVEQALQRTPWSHYAARLQSSPHELERRHLWLGAHAFQDYPVLLDRNILREHAYIVGDSGAGKTALGLIPVLTQLIRARDCAVVVLDLKGDKPRGRSH